MDVPVFRYDFSYEQMNGRYPLGVWNQKRILHSVLGSPTLRWRVAELLLKTTNGPSFDRTNTG